MDDNVSSSDNQLTEKQVNTVVFTITALVLAIVALTGVILLGK